jgi:glycine/D-amino acid oxidase-like deaminating enzyme
VRIVVIGSGIVGSSVAYECAKAGAQVTVFDAGRIAGGTSAASFAWTNATSKTPKSYFDINVAGMLAHLELKREFGAAPWFTQTGSLAWRTTLEGVALQREIFAREQQWGYSVEWLDKSELAKMEPDIDISAMGASPVAYHRDEGWIDPVLYAGALLRVASDRWNALIHDNTRVVAVETRAGQVRGVRTADGHHVEADVVVNCTGGWAKDGLEGVPAIPMVSTVGVLAFTPPVALSLRSQFHVDDLDVRPDGAGRLMMHKVSVDEMLPELKGLSVEGPEASALLAATARFLPGIRSAGIEAVRTAIRPIPQDRFPCAGEMPDVAGYHVAVTHSGVTLAPFLGKALAAEIIHGKIEERLTPFRPSRFFGSPVGHNSGVPAVFSA